ncbi:hypothetical protein AKJ09_10545 [Labilithrix luteola]|uniref:Uncharacterized protein n=1 Tax=Labilithrix luteola TaxID=1391654 RepID=A0A0K1QDZ7_9BACT|nr:hypothetical protein AKJ09_10545 [Labilithrix luteola]
MDRMRAAGVFGSVFESVFEKLVGDRLRTRARFRDGGLRGLRPAEL